MKIFFFFFFFFQILLSEVLKLTSVAVKDNVKQQEIKTGGCILKFLQVQQNLKYNVNKANNFG